MEKLRAYLKKEFEWNNHRKYRKWFDNRTAMINVSRKTFKK